MKSNKIIDIWEGQYRVFFNFYYEGRKMAFGFPKKGSSYSDVYFSIDGVEQDRISISEAKSYLSQSIIATIAPRVEGLGSQDTNPKLLNSAYGYCVKCGNKLSGDKSKKLCYRCWKDTQ